MKNTNEIFHSSCFACGTANYQGLHIKFKEGPTGITGSVSIPSRFQSYKDIVHGGIVATMLDAAMVQTLKKRSGKDPFTCRLEVRYLHPIPPGKILTINAQPAGERGKIIFADAEILCSNECCARARGAFTLK